MNLSDIEQGLQALGMICPPESMIVLAGSSALLLAGHLYRITDDADVLISEPKLSELESQITTVGEDLDLGDQWLSDVAKGYLDILPPDFEDRLKKTAQHGNLAVYVLHRQDMILMKLCAMRAEDLDDLEVLHPTMEEIEFVRSQLDRIARFRSDTALRVQLYLDEMYSQVVGND